MTTASSQLQLLYNIIIVQPAIITLPPFVVRNDQTLLMNIRITIIIIAIAIANIC
jgi:hypothetical protein